MTMLNELGGVDGEVVATGGGATACCAACWSAWCELFPVSRKAAATPTAATTGHQPLASRGVALDPQVDSPGRLERAQVEQLELGQGARRHDLDPPNTLSSSSGAATSSWS